MQVIDFIAGYGPWAWIVAGVILLALELVVPGGILLWLGISGIITGLAAFFQPSLGWPMQFLIFARGREAPADSPYLNRRAERFVGQEAILSEPILGGVGRVALDDTIWRIVGPDLAAGQRVRIVGNDGAVLKVEAA
jgi:inner membrane protein